MNTQREKFLLLRVYRNKDQRAFGELYNLYESRISRYLTFKLPTRNDAEDALSEVFVRAWEYMQTTPVENVSPFLYRIARTVCANFYRTKSRRPQEVDMSEGEHIIGDSHEVIEGTLSTVISIEAIAQLLPRLKEEYRDVVVMRYLDEMSMREIGEALEKNEGAVRTQLHRALKALRELLDQHHIENDYDDQSRNN